MQSQTASGYENRVWKISTAETKILLVLCYYALFGIALLSYLTVGINEEEDNIMAITEYFMCEAAGSGVECDRSGFDHFGYHGLAVLINLLFGFIPVVNLIFVINWTVAKESMKRIWMRYSKGNFITLTSFTHAKHASTITETHI